ncbi:MAG: glycosyltransferase [Candidatus Krumholzibacteria bacterium]|nr:glycosyltransferase [Candidatus Krumholzibacteria bacterium]
MDISVIIVSYNSRADLEPCLESLKKQSLFDRTEVVVVDNASTDGTPEMVRDRYPWVNLRLSGRNVGYSRGVNLGMQVAQGRYFLVLNPDTVVREHSIEKLFQFMEHTPDAGVVGPKLIFNDGNVQYSCRRFYNWKVLILRRTFLGRIFKNSTAISEHLMLDYDHETTTAVDWIIGACMLVRRQAVESVGPMDERFFLYFEDVDWCYRMKQKEWGVYYCPEAVVVHGYERESAQSVINRSFVAHLASLIRYYEKWNFVFYMLKKYREVVKILLFVVVDIVAFNVAFLSAYNLRILLGDVFVKPIFEIGVYERFVVFENLLFIFVYFSLGLYKIRRETSAVDELFRIGKAIVLASILLMASTYLSQIRTYSRVVVIFLVPFAISYDWILRTLVRRLHRGLISQKIDLKRVCIVGPMDKARELEERLVLDTSLGIDVVGVVETSENAGEVGGGSLGDLSRIGEIIDRFLIHELVFLPGAVPEGKLAELVRLGRRRVIDISVLTDYSGLVVHQATVANLAGRPVIAYRRDTRYALDRFAKRLLDIVLGTGFLVASVPFSVVYLLYSSIRGSAPYAWESRLGLGGKSFMLPAAGARSSNGPSDIVNLPLFWLVIVGRMSIVGPYPFPALGVALVDRAAKFRFDVRPGITGYWRVGEEQEIALDELLAQDANYTRNWSFVEDVKILVITFGNILMGKKRSLRLKDPS